MIYYCKDNLFYNCKCMCFCLFKDGPRQASIIKKTKQNKTKTSLYKFSDPKEQGKLFIRPAFLKIFSFWLIEENKTITWEEKKYALRKGHCLLWARCFIDFTVNTKKVWEFLSWHSGNQSDWELWDCRFDS